jgi:hypothetical protein
VRAERLAGPGLSAQDQAHEVPILVF